MTDLRQAAQAVVDATKFAIVPYYMKAQIEALRTALAEPQECTWTPDLRGVTTTGCGLNDVLIMEGTRAVYCFNCGKKIKFVEGE